MFQILDNFDTILVSRRNPALLTNLFTLTSFKPNRSFIQDYLHKFRWDQLFTHLTQKIIALLLLSIFFWIIKRIGKILIKRFFNRYQKKAQQNTSQKRISTLYTLTFNTFQYSLGFFWIYSLLSIIGIPIGTLIASAGIFSLAIGLGAQGFVSDIVNGFFILFEKQLDVGEYVSINNIQGTVTAIGLRTTQITSADGTVNFIPNRNITIISNFSRNQMNAIIQLRINTRIPIQKSLKILQRVNRTYAPQNHHIIGRPDVKGIITLPNDIPTFQIYIPTQNGAQFQVQREFLRHYLEALHRSGIYLNNGSSSN